MKHPPIQYPDDIAKTMVEEFIAGTVRDREEQELKVYVNQNHRIPAN
jgi:hypothetical protein